MRHWLVLAFVAAANFGCGGNAQSTDSAPGEDAIAHDVVQLILNGMDELHGTPGVVVFLSADDRSTCMGLGRQVRSLLREAFVTAIPLHLVTVGDHEDRIRSWARSEGLFGPSFETTLHRHTGDLPTPTVAIIDGNRTVSHVVSQPRSLFGEFHLSLAEELGLLR